MTGRWTHAEAVARAEPGRWRDYLLEVSAAIRDAAGARVAHARAYETYYDTPEPLRDCLDPAVLDGVKAFEAAGSRLATVRDRLSGEMSAALRGKAAELGARPPRAGEPDWVRAFRDLHALRLWRRERLDGIDVDLPQLFLRHPSEKGLFDDCLASWCRASGVRTAPLRSRVRELSEAGLLPCVSDPLGIRMDSTGPSPAFWHLVEREGAHALLAELSAAADSLPGAEFPVPRQAVESLEALSSPSPR